MKEIKLNTSLEEDSLRGRRRWADILADRKVSTNIYCDGNIYRIVDIEDKEDSDIVTVIQDLYHYEIIQTRPATHSKDAVKAMIGKSNKVDTKYFDMGGVSKYEIPRELYKHFKENSYISETHFGGTEVTRRTGYLSMPIHIRIVEGKPVKVIQGDKEEVWLAAPDFMENYNFE